jgi:hypothetical protein
VAEEDQEEFEDQEDQVMSPASEEDEPAAEALAGHWHWQGTSLEEEGSDRGRLQGREQARCPVADTVCTRCQSACYNFFYVCL